MSIDWSKPVQTRDGRKVRVLCTDAKGGEPVAALVSDTSQSEWLERWNADGSFLKSGVRHECDLINVPQKRWVNLYWEGDHLKSGGEHYLTKAEAIAQTRTKHSEYSTTIEVTLPASESSHD